MNEFVLDHSRDPRLQGANDASPYAETLLTLIREVLAGRRSIAAFCQAYTGYYVAHAPDGRMSPAQAEFLMQVQQRIDWADAEVSPTAKAHGWRDHEDLYGWLRERNASYEKDNASHLNIIDF